MHKITKNTRTKHKVNELIISESDSALLVHIHHSECFSAHRIIIWICVRLINNGMNITNLIKNNWAASKIKFSNVILERLLVTNGSNLIMILVKEFIGISRPANTRAWWISLTSSFPLRSLSAPTNAVTKRVRNWWRAAYCLSVGTKAFETSLVVLAKKKKKRL